MQRVFLEAEQFANLGGWTIDTQGFETQNMAYIFAHGLGKPVADATTTFLASESATYHVYVRTRNWSGCWHRGTPAGQFNLSINDVLLENTLGTESTQWTWQKAGFIELNSGEHTLALHDLTGFDGRCDAVYLTTEMDDIPTNEPEALNSLRRKLNNISIEDDQEEYDLIICGGGYAGVCAGITAQRQGLKFKLIQDRGVLGGCGSSEIRVWTGGKVCLEPYPKLGSVATLISPIKGQAGLVKNVELFEDDRKSVLFNQPNELLLNELIIGVEKASNDTETIKAVITRSVRTGRETRRRAKLFMDCTGDGVVARKAGCETMYGAEPPEKFNESLGIKTAKPLVMGHSTLWEVEDTVEVDEFPNIDWGIEFTEESAVARFNCCWDWETGFFRNQVTDIEYIRDYGLMTCYANWSFLKNRSTRRDEWKNKKLTWLSAIGGKRESYRVCGDLILTQNDIEEQKKYADGTGVMTWSIDLHMPDPLNQEKFAEPFLSCAYHRGIEKTYQVPYRTLYAKDVKNLFLGGRCISFSHVAFSSVRVMRTLGMLGEVVGLAANICKTNGCNPREVYAKHLEELKAAMTVGVDTTPPFGWLPGKEESYHFMRPVNSIGNPREDCWICFGGNHKEADKSLVKCIEKLGFSHKYDWEK